MIARPSRARVVLLSQVASLLLPVVACSEDGALNPTASGAATDEGASGPVTRPVGENALGGIASPDNTPDGEGVCTEVGDDVDGDGFTVEAGDCNDCNPNANPRALDVAGNGFDEDCNGTADDGQMACDASLAADGADPYDAAAALGLCKKVTLESHDWGLIEAKWVYPDGAAANIERSAEGRQILEQFGTLEPREGERILSISSGDAQEDPNSLSIEHTEAGNNTEDTGSVAPGFPVSSARCENLDYDELPDQELRPIAHDPVALEVAVRAPSNAKSLAYDFNFFTSEFPEYICTRYNDFFVALMDPPPEGALNGNISFDSLGQPVSVNNGLLQVCEPQTTPADDYPEQSAEVFECPLGTDELSGTGFENHAATGWLSTEVPITPGTVYILRFAVWDSYDHKLDSTVLIDNFRFSGEPATTGTKPVAPPVK